MELTEASPQMCRWQPHEVMLTRNRAALAGNKTIMCSVLFLDIVAYSRKSVSQQMELKNALNHALGAAISLVPTDDRIILDTGDGAAISFMSDVEDALGVAMKLREILLEEAVLLGYPLPVRSGINLGPVRLIEDINGQPNIVGDGINVAQRVMDFAEAGQILISRSYHEAISNVSHEYAGMLHYHGRYTDKHVREHEVYSVSRKGVLDLSVADAETGMAESMPGQAVGGSLGFIDNLSRQRPLLIGGMLVVALLLVAVKLVRNELKDAATDPSAVMAQIQFADHDRLDAKSPGDTNADPPYPAPAIAASPAPEQAVPDAVPVANAMNKVDTIKPAIPVAVDPVTLGTLDIAVTPWGEVYVDGIIRGISPPLTRITLKPGSHHVEIRNRTFAPYSQYFKVIPGESREIRYKFADPLH